jgi:c-di-GMP-binding flagellar brake protein YcgR
MSFQIGDYVEIEISEGYYRGEYASRIVRVKDQSLVIVAPRLAGTIVPLKTNTTLTIHVCKEDARYVFEGKILTINEQEFGHLTIAVPESLDRRQRRSDVRLAMRIPVELLYFYRDGIPVASYTISSIDISAGGIRIETAAEFPLHSKIMLAIMLPDNDEIMAYADVVRVGRLTHSEPGSNNSCWASLKFINMSDNKKKKILKFIYKQQELRVKGLI